MPALKAPKNKDNSVQTMKSATRGAGAGNASMDQRPLVLTENVVLADEQTCFRTRAWYGGHFVVSWSCVEVPLLGGGLGRTGFPERDSMTRCHRRAAWICMWVSVV